MVKDKIEKIMKKLYESAFENSVSSPYLCKQNPYGSKEATEDVLEVLAKVLEEKDKEIADLNAQIKKWKEGAEINFEAGDKRPCGHFVQSILSFCPVCREIASLQQQLTEARGKPNWAKVDDKWVHIVFSEGKWYINGKEYMPNKALYGGGYKMSLGLKPKEIARGIVTLYILFLSASIMVLAIWKLIDLGRWLWNF